jgi:hypothetical protein
MDVGRGEGASGLIAAAAMAAKFFLNRLPVMVAGFFMQVRRTRRTRRTSTEGRHTGNINFFFFCRTRRTRRTFSGKA